MARTISRVATRLAARCWRAARTPTWPGHAHSAGGTSGPASIRPRALYSVKKCLIDTI